MTNEPEPNTRAGEAQAHQLATALMGVERFTADGNFHPDYLAMLTRPLPQPSELVERPSEAIEVLAGPYRQLDMDGVIVGVSRQAIDETLAYLTQLEAQLAKLQADGDKLAGALERSRQGWSNVLELGLLPVQHQSTALGLQEAATQALTEWKDRA